MTIWVECSNCHKKHPLSDETAGLRLKCGDCETLITIPEAEPNPQASPSAQASPGQDRKSAWRVSGPVLLRIVLYLAIVGGTGVVVALILQPSPAIPKPDDESPRLGSPEFQDPHQDQADTNAASSAEESPPVEQLSDEAIDVMRMLRVATASGEIEVPMLQRRIQEFAPQYPKLRVSGTPGKPIWNTVRVNTSKTGLCVIRFTSPLFERADLFWTFAYPGNAVESWMILPAQGQMQGFWGHDQRSFLQFADAKLPAVNGVISQTLIGGHIVPGKEYLIWFALRTEEPIDMHFAITLSPVDVQKHREMQSVEDITSHMGLEILSSDLESSPTGKEQALRFCSSQFAKGEAEFRQGVEPLTEFSKALRAVSSQFPDLPSATKDGPPKWQRVVLNQSGASVDAVRLTSPLTAPARLSVAVIAPETFRGWALLPVSEDGMVQPDYELSADVRIQDLKLPQPNVAVFHHFSEAEILPGQAYLLWFATWSDQPMPVQMALKFSAPGLATKRPSAKEIAAYMGVEIEPQPESSLLAAVQDRAHQISMSGRNTDDIQRLVRSIPESFPLLELTMDRDKPVFNSLQADEDNRYLAAVRFRSPLMERADLDVLLVGSGASLNANIAPLETGVHNAAFRQENLDLENVELPTPNLGVSQSLRNGPIQPGQDYFIWFAATEEKPAEIQVAARVSPAGESVEPSSLRAVGRAIGVKFPISPGPEGSYVLGEHDAAVTAVKFDAEGKMLLSAGQDKQAKLWDVTTRERSNQAVLPSRDILALLSGESLLQTLALAKAGDSMQFVRLDEERPIHEWPLPDLPFRAAALSPNGKRLAVCFADRDQGEVRIYDAETGEKTAEQKVDGNLLYDCLFSVDSNTLLTAGGQFIPGGIDGDASGQITFWNASDLAREHQLMQSVSFINRVEMNSQGGHVVSATYQGRLSLYDSKTHELRSSISQDGLTGALRMAPDGNRVALGCEDGRIRLWDWRHNRIWVDLNGHTGKVRCLDISADSRWLVSGGSDGTVRLWDLARFAASPPLDPETPIATNSLGMKLVPIPAGEFRMGASPGDNSASNVETPPHPVTISKSFYLGQHEVTVDQFAQFVAATKHKTTAEQNGKGGTVFRFQTSSLVSDPKYNWREPGFQEPGFVPTGHHPVVQVTWQDALAFCDWLSQKENATYRLPTEAEWEYACRAGSQTRWSHGDKLWQLVNTANVSDVSLSRVYPLVDQYHPLDDGFASPSPVGHYLPNAFGLYDMHGNVAELCRDWYDPRTYTGFLRTDPEGPKEGRHRVVRGGDFLSRPVDTRSSKRDAALPDYCSERMGFRVLREIP